MCVCRMLYIYNYIYSAQILLAPCRLHQASNLPWTRHGPWRVMGWDPAVCTPRGETTWGQCEQSKSSGALGPYLGPLDWTIDLPWEYHVTNMSRFGSQITQMDHRFTMAFLHHWRQTWTEAFRLSCCPGEHPIRLKAWRDRDVFGKLMVCLLCSVAGELHQRMFGAEGAKLWHWTGTLWFWVWNCWDLLSVCHQYVDFVFLPVWPST